MNPISRRSALRRTNASLAKAAGRAERPEFEPLENRQLLFTLTVSPLDLDPFTGVGTVSATFGYLIPFLGPTTDRQDPQIEVKTEDFDADDPGPPGLGGFPVPPGPVPPGQFGQFQFQGSNILVRHNLSSLLLQREPGSSNNNWLRATMGPSQQLEFVLPSLTRRVTILIGDGLNASTTIVELFADDQLMATYTGTELDALGQPPQGNPREYTFQPGGNLVFNRIVFRSTQGAASDTFYIDDITWTEETGEWSDYSLDRIFGATLRFTGPVGASVSIFDLYGRPMQNRLDLGRPRNSQVPNVDPLGIGFGWFNEGIGRIEIRGTNDRSALTMFGGTVTKQEPFVFTLVGSLMGLFDAFEEAGFGFDAIFDPDLTVIGLPPGPGSLIIGAPQIRPLDSSPTTLPFPVTSGFTRPEQGIMVMDDRAMGSVQVHAMVFGTSRFNTIDRYVSGVQMGSINVAGDAGLIMVGGDAGIWVREDDSPVFGAGAGSELRVGRTLQQFHVAGRNLMNITVVGDLNSPNTRPLRDIFRYFENESVPTFAPGPTMTVQQWIAFVLSANDGLARSKAFADIALFFGGRDQPLVFAATNYRNDTILSAEWVGSVATAVEIHGELGRGRAPDPINTADDPSDVFGFSVDGTQDIVVQLDASALFQNTYIRIVDYVGRTVATPALSESFRDFVVLRYRPTAPGIYYIVVQSEQGGDGNVTNTNYVLTISGLAPTTLGAVRSAAGWGRNPAANFAGSPPTLTLLSGSMGSIRVGTGFVTGAGAEVATVNFLNPGQEEEADTTLEWRASSFSIPGNLYGIVTGSDILGAAVDRVSLIVGGHVGVMVVGISPVVGNNVREGDVARFSLRTGGSIGMVDIRGAIGIEQDVDDPAANISADPLPNSVLFITGQNPTLRGDIGMFRVGSNIAANVLSIRTSNNSIIGGLLVSQDLEFDPTISNQGILSIGGAFNGIDLQLGTNSDLRFFDTPQIDVLNVQNRSIPLPANAAPITLVDDAGGQVNIRIIGGNGNAGGRIITIPVSGSLGQAIGRLEVNLDGGARLQLSTIGAPATSHVVSIGRIIITGSDAASSIGIDGPNQIDVWRIDQQDGDPFNEIVNTTPFGDIVAVDVEGLDRLEIRTGDLGRTQMPAWGPRLIGPFLGVTVAAGGGDVGGAIPVNPTALLGRTPALYRPVNNSTGTVFLDDIGSPVDPFLDGMIVRTGNLTTVQVGGAIGDVIVPAGDLVTLTANFDRMTPAGRFDGIVGTIYANRISRVNIGDGLAAPTSSPLSTTGIFANDDILSITGDIPGAFISGRIMAANIVGGNTTPGTFPTDGIDLVELRGGAGGSYIDAYIGVQNLDAFWISFFTFDSAIFAGTLNLLSGQGANFFRSNATALFLNNFRLTDGFFDASTINVGEDLGTVTVSGYRNSTIDGSVLEFRINHILVGGNVNVITTNGRLGDINDLRVDVLGRVTEISGRNISRTSIDVDERLTNLRVTQNFRGSSLTVGRLDLMDVGDSIRSSEISVGGPLVLLKAGNEITNTNISVTGPDGRLDRLTARTRLTGRIFVAGPTETIEVTEGDMAAHITTVTNQRGLAGNIRLLTAARDLDITTDIAGTVERFVAGRHLGNQFRQTVILVHGDVKNIDVPNGQLYADIRIGQNLTDRAVIGTAFHRPGASNIGLGSIIAFGRIENVDVNGDFAGRIISHSGGIGVITLNDGSLLPSAEIMAFDGNLQNVFINNGNLYGRIHADYTLFAIRLNGSEDGVFGDIGVNPAFNPGAPYSQFRNQLPPNIIATAAIQGPRITAGHNLGRIILTNGSIFEAFIHAGRALGTIDVTGDIRNDNLTIGPGTVIAAGSQIFLVHATGDIRDTLILAGIKDFGADQWAGGIGANADTVRSGRIQTVQADGNLVNVAVSAGMQAGADGIYNTGDELVVLGISYVREVTAGGTATGTSVFADSPTLTVSPGIIRAGTTLPLADPDLSSGVAQPGWQLLPADGTPFEFTWRGVTGTISFTTDRGAAYWVPGLTPQDPLGGRIVLVNTSLNDQLIVSAPGTLTDFRIVSNDDASMGLVQVDADLAGNSKIVIDAYVLRIQTGNVFGNGLIRTGMNVRNITTGSFMGVIDAAFWARDIIINGNFGTADDFDDAVIRSLAGMSVTINGTDSGLVSYERDLSSFTVNGAMSRARLRSGASVGTISLGSMSESRITVRDRIGPVTIAGGMDTSTIQAGGDLGEDGQPGGSGFAADAATTGHIESVTIGGNFTRSSIVAGFLRGEDGFFGTQDDSVASGRSTIGNVTVAGTQVGSNLNTEQYRVAATGSVGTVTIAGQAVTAVGNFRVRRLDTEPTPIRVLDLQTFPEAQTWYARIFFNQSMDLSTIGPALTISEIRNGTLVPLQRDVDWVVGDWDAVTNSILIIFMRDVTDRDLPQTPGLPGPGVFRFHLESDILRATVVTARLDGDSNGFATANEDYSMDSVVGDAGDKFAPEIIFVDDPLNPTNPHRVDFYGPADLDLVLDNNLTPDGLPDPNITHTIRGSIGDHPDVHLNFFPAASDTDIYKITLQAGQILRLGNMEGTAMFAGRFLVNDAFQSLPSNGPDAIRMSADPGQDIDLTIEDAWLIKRTGTYYIVITNNLGDYSAPGVVPSSQFEVGTVGDYNFTVTIFDDGDSGFRASTNAGNGTDLVTAPAPIVFAGPNQVFQDPSDPTYDDRTVVFIGDFTFFLDPGPDGIRGTGDDIVTGSNSNGITSVRQGSFLSTTVESAIGPRGHSGVPGDVAADVDIYHLNSGLPIAPGRVYTIKVKLADLGADLGSFSQSVRRDFSEDVQFAIFDTTGATDIDDALLVFSPTDFRPTARPTADLAQRGPISYGYDQNGDFFITFVTPDRIGGDPGEPATFAIYLQGAFNTDYTLEVTTDIDAPAATIPQSSQNFVLETRGGVIDWLEAGGLKTTLAPFASSVLGFTGTVAGLPVDTYIINNVVNHLRSIFQASGFNINLSTTPATFEFQPYSTVFLTSSSDPTIFFFDARFGHAQHSDPYNADRTDEAVVFLPTFATLGYTPSRADVDLLVDSLTAAIGRRIGELMGLRIEEPSGFLDDEKSIMSSNSVFNPLLPGQVYRYTNQARALAIPSNTAVNSGFYLGQQNAFALLDKFLTP